MNRQPETYWRSRWRQYRRHHLGMIALAVVAAFILVGIYAPFLASSKPLCVYYDGQWYFPLFRYLLFPGFYTKRLDLFFNALALTFPFFILSFFLKAKTRIISLSIVAAAQLLIFTYAAFSPPRDPASDAALNKSFNQFQKTLPDNFSSWQQELPYINPYARLNLIVNYLESQKYNQSVIQEADNPTVPLATPWQMDQSHVEHELSRLNSRLESDPNDRFAKMELERLKAKQQWLKTESAKLQWIVMPLIRPFHWEDDAGGDLAYNQRVPWWNLTRINHKDLVAALIFGVRISLVVGIISVFIALCIGIPVGAFAGYYGSNYDIVVSRLMEIWEAMPMFFMLLLVVAIVQSKSIFLVILVIGLFGWTNYSRYIRGEFFKQRNLPYIEACHAIGFKDSYIMFSHILPNAIPPVLTLLPFGIMGAITAEAGLSFLGLGEEGSCSWGVLMDEGRQAFPGQSYLLWPPAILLTILLVAIAILGDTMRDVIDPKMQRYQTPGTR